MPARLLGYAALSILAACADGGDEVGSSAAAVDVSWTNVVGVDAVGNDLTKTDPENSWNAGAVSVEAIPANGYVEFTTAEASTTKSAGLSSGDTDQGYADIDFAIRLRSNGSVGVYEGGVLRGSFGVYAAGDLFRIEVEDGVVSYRRNGTPFYVSTVAATGPLLVDTSLFSPGSTINDVVLVSTSLSWQNVVGVSIAGDDLTKTDTAGTWTSGASTVETLAGDGFIEFSAGEASTAKAAGLSSGDDSRSFADIDFAIRLNGNGAVTVYEDGLLRGTFGTYVAGDRFRVEVSGGAVTYSMNGARPFYTSAVLPVFPLLVDTAFLTPGATINDVTLTEAAASCPAYDGGGLVCSGSFTVANAFDLAEIADCANITGNLTINAPGMTEASLPRLERVGGVVTVTADSALRSLRFPELKQADDVLITYTSGTPRAVDLSRLQLVEELRTRLRTFETSVPCLGTASVVDAIQGVNGWGPIHAPRLAAVTDLLFGSLTAPVLETAGDVNAELTAPALVSVTGDLAGDIDAPVLAAVGGDVSASPLDAPSLVEIGGWLTARAGQNLPVLERVQRLILGDAPAIDLPSLVEVTDILQGGSISTGGSCAGTAPAATVVNLPALQTAGSLRLCWNGLQSLLVPSLQVVDGRFFIRSTGVTEIDFPALIEVTTGNVEMYVRGNFPLLERIGGRLAAQAAIDAPALTDIGGALLVRAPLNVPSLLRVGEQVDVRASFFAANLDQIGGVLTILNTPANITVALASLTTVDGVIATNAARLASLQLPSLTTVVGVASAPNGLGSGDVAINATRLSSLSMPDLTAIPGDLRITQHLFLTSLNFASLTSLGPQLIISGNENLPNCYATRIRTRLVNNGWTGTWFINGNNGTGSCP